MAKTKLKTRELVIAAGLAAVSAVLQIIHIGYMSPFGIWIDLVAVTWAVALLLFDLRVSFIVSIIGAIIITLFAPDTWLGAVMKWLASFPILFFLGIWHKKLTPLSFYKTPFRLVIPVLLGIILRCAIAIPLNYYWAIPIWTGMTPEKAMLAIPWYILAIFNIIQSIVDVSVAWILVYTFRLSRYASRPTQE
jgi:riboflavin transporter FmnP